MKLCIAAAALATALFAQPAQATMIVEIEASASGTTDSLLCTTGPQCMVSESFAAAFKSSIVLDAFVDGIASFRVGPNANAGIMSGTVLDLGGGLLTGTAFTFAQDRTCGGPCANIRTSLSASTFNVRQVLPSVAAAVPEPGTWATMLIGFGAIGATLRRKRAGQGGRLAVA